jgi:hypothetical protein
MHDRLMNTKLPTSPSAAMSLIQHYKKNILQNTLKSADRVSLLSAQSASDGAICRFTSTVNGPLFNLHHLRAVNGRALQAHQLAIEPTCILASMKRNGSEPGYYCASPRGPKEVLGPPGGNRAACISRELLNYTTWVFNQSLACMNNPSRPLDPSLLFQKFNNESGFNYFVGFSGGMGIGGMTSIAVKELNLNSKVFTQIFNPFKRECLPFAKAMKNKPNNVLNRCEWLDMEDGFARSLIYSIGLFLHIRDTQLASLKDDFERANLEDYRALNLAALAIYGPEGLGAKRHISAVLKSKPKSFNEFKQKLSSRVPYLNNIQSKSREVLMMTSPPKRSPEDCSGT